MNREPVLSANTITGAVLAVLTLLGANLSQAQLGAVEQLIGAAVALLGPIVAGWIARRKVTPLPDAGDRHPRRD